MAAKGRGRGKGRKPPARRGSTPGVVSGAAKGKSAAFTGADYVVFEVDGDSQDDKFDDGGPSGDSQDDTSQSELSIVGPPIRASQFSANISDSTEKSKRGRSSRAGGKTADVETTEETAEEAKVESSLNQASNDASSKSEGESSKTGESTAATPADDANSRPSVIQQNKSAMSAMSQEDAVPQDVAINAGENAPAAGDASATGENAENAETASTAPPETPAPAPAPPARGNKRKKGRKGAKAKPKKPPQPAKKAEYDPEAIQEELDKVSLMNAAETVPVTTTSLSLSSPFKNLTRDRAPKRTAPPIDSAEASVPPKKRAWDRLSKAKEAAAAALREEEQAAKTPVAPKPRHKQYALIAAQMEQEEKEKKEKEEAERLKNEEEILRKVAQMKETSTESAGVPSGSAFSASATESSTLPSSSMASSSSSSVVTSVPCPPLVRISSAEVSGPASVKPFPAHMKVDHSLMPIMPRASPSPRGNLPPMAVSPGLPPNVPPMAHASSGGAASLMAHPSISNSTGRQPGPYVPQVQSDKQVAGESSSGGRLVGGNPTPPMTPPISAGQQLPAASTAPALPHHADLRNMMGPQHPLAKSGRSTPMSSTATTSSTIPPPRNSSQKLPQQQQQQEVPHPVAPVPPSSAHQRGSGVSASPSPAALPPLPVSSTPGPMGGKLSTSSSSSSSAVSQLAGPLAAAISAASSEKRPPSAPGMPSSRDPAISAFAALTAVYPGFLPPRGPPFSGGPPPFNAMNVAAAAALHPALLRATAEARNLPPPPPTDYHRPPSRPSSSTPIAALSPHVTSDLSHLGAAAAAAAAAKGLSGVGGDHPPPTPTPDAPGGIPALVHFPISWQGYLTLKNDYAFIQMHFVSGNQDLARHALPTEQSAPMTPGGAPMPGALMSAACLRVNQRMRLETQQLEGVIRRMQMPSEHCLLMAVPHGRTREETVKNTEELTTGFINYLRQKQAAGIVNVNTHPGSNMPGFVVHIFPPCDFTQRKIAECAPSLSQNLMQDRHPHLMIIITTCA